MSERCVGAPALSAGRFISQKGGIVEEIMMNDVTTWQFPFCGRYHPKWCARRPELVRCLGRGETDVMTILNPRTFGLHL